MLPASRIPPVARSEPAATSLRSRAALVSVPPSRPALAAPAPTVLDNANYFIATLLELPLAAWLTIGRGLIADHESLTVRQSAWSDVEAALSAYGLAVDAWHVRDTLETAVCLVSRQMPCWSRDERCQLAATHGAAEAAALALMAGPHLRVDIIRSLTAPFAPFTKSSFGCVESDPSFSPTRRS